MADDTRSPDAAKCQKCGGCGLVGAFGEAGEFGATVPCPECYSHQEADFRPGNYFGYGYGMRW